MLFQAETVYHPIFTEWPVFPRLLSMVLFGFVCDGIEYRVKKAKELGLPIPVREVTVAKNPQQDFVSALEEKRANAQIADSVATMVFFSFSPCLISRPLLLQSIPSFPRL